MKIRQYSLHSLGVNSQSGRVGLLVHHAKGGYMGIDCPTFVLKSG